jgi:uncharacterized membrane protein YgcG
MFMLRIRPFLALGLFGFALLASFPIAADDIAAIEPKARVEAVGWQVDGLTGKATVRKGSAPAKRLKVRQIISAGSDIHTGARGVVFLSRGGDRLVIQPNTKMRIGEPEPGGLLDHFMQSLGSVFYDVEPRKNRAFGVTAPRIAATVKGTKFLVTVESQMNSVRVDEGSVLVSSEDDASEVIVTAGRTATVEPGQGPGIRVSDSGISSVAPVDTVSAAPMPKAKPSSRDRGGKGGPSGSASGSGGSGGGSGGGGSGGSGGGGDDGGDDD